MDVARKEELKVAMWKVIEQEKLSRPENIQIRSPLYGIRRTAGRCIRSRLNGRYRLIVSTTIATFVKDPNGNYRNKMGQRLRRVISNDIPDTTILDTAAHEMAHIKFWSHTPEHHAYTQHLLSILKEKLQWEA